MALDYAARIFGHEKNAVLISIRESSFDSGRNTPARFLQDLILQLQGAGLAVYLIPDQEVTHNTDQLPSGVTIIEAAAYNIPLRLALHELARVSICSGSGPTNFISLSVRKPSLVVIHPMRPEIHISSPDYLSQQGYTIGSPQPLPWIPSNQVWLWDPLVTVKEVCATAQTLMSSGTELMRFFILAAGRKQAINSILTTAPNFLKIEHIRLLDHPCAMHV